VTEFTVAISGTGFREWAFTRCSPQHEVHGKIHLRNGSSVAFDANAELCIIGVMQSLFLCGVR